MCARDLVRTEKVGLGRFEREQLQAPRREREVPVGAPVVHVLRDHDQDDAVWGAPRRGDDEDARGAPGDLSEKKEDPLSASQITARDCFRASSRAPLGKPDTGAPTARRAKS